jgi:hypothetical protein
LSTVITSVVVEASEAAKIVAVSVVEFVYPVVARLTPLTRIVGVPGWKFVPVIVMAVFPLPAGMREGLTLTKVLGGSICGMYPTIGSAKTVMSSAGRRRCKPQN